MKRFALVGAVLLLVYSLVAAAFTKKTVSLASLEWPPYIGQALPNKGYVAQIAVEAFARAGYEVNIVFLPWNRAVKETLQGKHDAYFPEYASDEVAQQFLFSYPFPGGPLGFFKRKGAPIVFRSLEDLKLYRIGVVRGYVNAPEFDAADYLTKDMAPDDLSNLKKLIGKHIDLAVADKFVGFYLLKNQWPEQKDAVEFVEPPLESKDLFVCFPKSTPGSQELHKAFNLGLQRLKQDGHLDALIAQRGF